MTVFFSDLRVAAYCPRKLYYVRRDDRDPPDAVVEVRDLAFRYPDLIDADDGTLSGLPIEVAPSEYRDRLRETRRSREDWAAIADPPARSVNLVGRDCRGIAHKVLEEPPRPSIVSAGSPPERGVWEPQRVHAVAASKALAWERERPVERAVVEYPAYGVVRDLRLGTRNKAAYRRTLRTVRGIDGPPSRLRDRSKCGSCEYSEECGVRTRTMASLLGR
ncbi:MAG: CRISPR-associated exonuclease Cas4 [Halobacteriales archaeon]|jgi:CRISPR-associated exonuclease Cas4